jgi:transposase
LPRERVLMSGQESKKLHVIKQVLSRYLRQSKAAELLGICIRQVRRLMKRVGEDGDRGVIHGSRGKTSNRRICKEVRQRVIGQCLERYIGFGPTLVSEKLAEETEIKLSRETIRKWMREEGIEYGRRKRPKHRQYRQRRPHFGEMLQMDGSHHRWLEERGLELVLMACIDDATSTAFGRFFSYEGTTPAFDVFKRYAKRYGLPCSVYLDRHTTYKSNKKLTVEEELAGVEGQSQFERAMKELGVEVIHANSPQGKGRVERLFNTLQDRLVKELRVQGINTEAEANKFLPSYWHRFNLKFSVDPFAAADFHRPVAKIGILDSSLSIKTPRRVRRDFTVVYNNRQYQLLQFTPAKWVTLHQLINGQIRISYDHKFLRYKTLPLRAKKELKPALRRPQKPVIPAPEHPWRRFGWLKGNIPPQQSPKP